MDLKGMITVTALAAAIFCCVMALWSNYPIMLAPAIGADAYFAYQIVLGQNIPWPAALGLVFYSGVLFFIIAVSGLRQKILEAFPNELKIAITAGIGLFIAFVGLRNAGLVVGNPKTFVALGNLLAPVPLLALGGVILCVVLLIRRVPAAILLTILGISAVGLLIPVAGGGMVTKMPARAVDWPSSIEKLWFKLDFVYFWAHPSQSILVVLSFLFSDLFGSLAALTAICSRAGLVGADGKLARLKQALEADAAAGMGGALLGTSTTHYFIESAVAVEEGARTGLASIVVGICFLLALFFNPIIQIIPAVATAPALIMIGIFMTEGLATVNLRDLSVGAPTVITILLMLLASVQDGLAIGFLSYVIIQIAIGRAKMLPVMTYGLAAIFLLHYVVPLLMPGK